MTTHSSVLHPDEVCAPTTVHAIGTEAADTLAGALRSLADPLRLRMLSAIATDPRGESCVCDLAELADVSQPTVSHHLKVLRESGMLSSQRRGTWVWYRIAPARQQSVAALLEAFSPATVLAADPDDADQQIGQAMDERVTRLAETLAQQHRELDHALVLTVVRESYAGLVRSAKLTGHLIPRTERFARQRLADLTRDRRTGPGQVLFICVQNAGRSQLAAALVNRLSGGKVVARSAGSTPAAAVHPQVRALLTEPEAEQEQGSADAQAGDAYPKPLTDDAVRAADVVITMGCGDVCPIVPGVRYEEWVVGDPALASAAGVRAIRDDLEVRVRDLLETLITD